MVFTAYLLQPFEGLPGPSLRGSVFPFLPAYGAEPDYMLLAAQREWLEHAGVEGAGDEPIMSDPERAMRRRQQEQKGYEAGPGTAGFVEGERVSYTFTGDPNDPVLRWHPYIMEAAAQTGLPPHLIAAVIRLESGGNPQATGPATESGARARGLMQIMDFNWRPGEDKYDPRTNILKGAQMLAERVQRAEQLYGVSGQRAYEIALASYLGDWNWDTGTYRGAADAFGTDGPKYIQTVFGYMQGYQNAFQAQPMPSAAPTPTAASGPFAGSSLYGTNAPLTQGYGHTDFARTSGIYPNNFHDGIDIGIGQGTRLTAPSAGTVVYAGLMGSYGGTVQIRLDNGYIIHLSHLSAIQVKPGQRVDAGTLLGLSGGAVGTWGAGTSTGAHLHLRVLDPQGRSIDPRTIFII